MAERKFDMATYARLQVLALATEQTAETTGSERYAELAKRTRQALETLKPDRATVYLLRLQKLKEPYRALLSGDSLTQAERYALIERLEGEPLPPWPFAEHDKT